MTHPGKRARRAAAGYVWRRADGLWKLVRIADFQVVATAERTAYGAHARCARAEFCVPGKPNASLARAIAQAEACIVSRDSS
ncbi:MAG: hypothetical protein FJX72_03060 [Armatimonadetes bacterium]|nr:hypothetical protein [Armatimonadota bacterium]